MTKDEEIKTLKKALRKVIFDLSRIDRILIEVDTAGNIHDVRWNDQVREWAKLCDIDIDNYDPSLYGH